MRALSEGLRQEVKPYNIRTTIISPGAVATELPNSITEPDVAESIHKFYEAFAIPADSFAQAVAFARPTGWSGRERVPVPAHAPGAVSTP